jgi:hypothetical protein
LISIENDICTSIVVVNSADTGKKVQVWKSTNFDAGLYDIRFLVGFDTLNISKFSDIWSSDHI